MELSSKPFPGSFITITSGYTGKRNDLLTNVSIEIIRNCLCKLLTKISLFFRAWALGFVVTLPIMYKIQIATGYGLFGEGEKNQEKLRRMREAHH